MSCVYSYTLRIQESNILLAVLPEALLIKGS